VPHRTIAASQSNSDFCFLKTMSIPLSICHLFAFLIVFLWASSRQIAYQSKDVVLAQSQSSLFDLWPSTWPLLRSFLGEH
jgi:hypothetical protein